MWIYIIQSPISFNFFLYIIIYTGQFQKEKSPNSSLRRSHGLLNMLGWAILMPIGAMVARYMRKWDPTWFYAHGIIQSIGFILGLSGVICGLVLENRLKASSVGKHKGIGITVLVLGSLQVIITYCFLTFLSSFLYNYFFIN